MPTRILFFILVLCSFIPFVSDAQSNSFELNDALTKMRITINNQDVRYVDKTSPAAWQKSACYLYIDRRGNSKPILMLRIQYYGMLLLNVYEYLLTCNGNEIRFSNQDILKGIDNGSYYSSCRIKVTSDMLAILRGINGTGTVKLKYIGTQNDKLMRLSLEEQLAIKNVIRVYDLLNKD